MYIGAIVLVPKGFDQETTRHYPARSSIQGHFGENAPFGFTEKRGSGDAGPTRGAATQDWVRGSPAGCLGRDWMRRQCPADGRDHVAASDAVLRRLVCSQFGYQRTLSGYLPSSTELVPELEKPVFDSSPTQMRSFLTGGLDRGRYECAAPPDSASRLLRRRLVHVAAIPSTSIATRWWTSTVTRTRLSPTTRGRRCRSDSCRERPRGSRSSLQRPHEPTSRPCSAAKRAAARQFHRPDAGYETDRQRGLSAAARRTARPASSTRAQWPGGTTRDMTSPTTSFRIGVRSARRSQARCMCMSATWTTTTSNLAVYRMEDVAAKLTNPRANFTFEYGRPMKPTRVAADDDRCGVSQASWRSSGLLTPVARRCASRD